MRFYVYELSDETGAVFYVGKGSGRRMWDHKYKAVSGQKTPRADRIRAILARGGTIQMAKVFVTDDEVAAYAEEVRLIAFYGRAALTNQTSGGCSPRNMSAEARERIAASRRGVKASAETRQKQRERKLGSVMPQEVKAKIAATQATIKKPWAAVHRSHEYRDTMSRVKTGYRLSEEHRRKISEARRGHSVSQETRRKISVAKKGTPRLKITPEMQQEIQRLYQSGVSFPKIAKLLSVSETCISNHMNGIKGRKR